MSKIIKHTYGTTTILPTEGTSTGQISRTEYSFGGWYKDSSFTQGPYEQIGATEITSAQSYYAKWNTNVYNITYILNGGSHTGNPTTYTFETETITFNKPTKTGYTGSFSPATITKGSTGNKTITASYTANTYTVVYDGNGATEGFTTSSIHTYDTTKTLTTNGYSRTGYTFKNWNTKSDGSGTSYTNGQSVTNLATQGSVTLYAQWTANQYDVTLNENGGTIR